MVKSTDATNSAKVLRKWFAMHGLPHVIVSDNGPGFASSEFGEFLKFNGVRHMFTALYHPSSNGQAERMVRTLKDALKVLKGDVETKLCRFLFKYRITPHTSTGRSPAELLLGRQLRSALSLLHPASNAQRVVPEEVTEGKCRKFALDDSVLVRNYGIGDKWVPAIVVSILGEVNYKVLLSDGRIWHRDVDQMVRRHLYHENEDRPTVEPVGAGLPLEDLVVPASQYMPSGDDVRARDELADAVEPWSVPARVPVSSPNVKADPIPVGGPSSSAAPVTGSSVSSGPVATELRRSTRERRPPPKLKDYVKS